MNIQERIQKTLEAGYGILRYDIHEDSNGIVVRIPEAMTNTYKSESIQDSLQEQTPASIDVQIKPIPTEGVNANSGDTPPGVGTVQSGPSAVNQDFNIDTGTFELKTDAIDEALDRVMENTKQSLKEPGTIPPTRGTDDTMNISSGDWVEVEFKDGHTEELVVSGLLVENAASAEIPRLDVSLYHYWNDPEVSRNDGVVVVETDDGTELYFPESKVSTLDPDKAKVGFNQDKSGKVVECPNCGESVEEYDEGVIEGLDGDLYCSIECLNEHE